MGFYVNPSAESKEQFLRSTGIAVPATFKWSDTPKGSLPVVLIDNDYMTAAGIAYNEQEFEIFTKTPGDNRTKRIYTVRIADLVAFANDRGFNAYVKQNGLAT